MALPHLCPASAMFATALMCLGLALPRLRSSFASHSAFLSLTLASPHLALFVHAWLRLSSHRFASPPLVLDWASSRPCLVLPCPELALSLPYSGPCSALSALSLALPRPLPCLALPCPLPCFGLCLAFPYVALPCLRFSLPFRCFALALSVLHLELTLPVTRIAYTRHASHGLVCPRLASPFICLPLSRHASALHCLTSALCLHCLGLGLALPRKRHCISSASDLHCLVLGLGLAWNWASAFTRHWLGLSLA